MPNSTASFRRYWRFGIQGAPPLPEVEAVMERWYETSEGWRRFAELYTAEFRANGDAGSGQRRLRSLMSDVVAHGTDCLARTWNSGWEWEPLATMRRWSSAVQGEIEGTELCNGCARVAPRILNEVLAAYRAAGTALPPEWHDVVPAHFGHVLPPHTCAEADRAWQMASPPWLALRDAEATSASADGGWQTPAWDALGRMWSMHRRYCIDEQDVTNPDVWTPLRAFVAWKRYVLERRELPCGCQPFIFEIEEKLYAAYVEAGYDPLYIPLPDALRHLQPRAVPPVQLPKGARRPSVKVRVLGGVVTATDGVLANRAFASGPLAGTVRFHVQELARDEARQTVQQLQGMGFKPVRRHARTAYESR